MDEKMSMNLHLEASTMATIKLPNGKKKRQKVVEKFDLWQTPTSITYKCLDGNTYELYKEWIMSYSKPEKVYIYKEDDIFEEGKPVGFEMYNPAEVHIKELDEWIKYHEGWKIEWFAL